MKNNIKIALFMGYLKTPYECLPDSMKQFADKIKVKPNVVYQKLIDVVLMIYSEQLLYDKSWDWLIPVIEKLNNTEISSDKHKLFISKLDIIECDLGRHLDIKRTYEQVIEAINILNS